MLVNQLNLIVNFYGDKFSFQFEFNAANTFKDWKFNYAKLNLVTTSS